jgi:hypothetical protein
VTDLLFLVTTKNRSLRQLQIKLGPKELPQAAIF